MNAGTAALIIISIVLFAAGLADGNLWLRALGVVAALGALWCQRASGRDGPAH